MIKDGDGGAKGLSRMGRPSLQPIQIFGSVFERFAIVELTDLGEW